jgi:hypothetical protein
MTALRPKVRVPRPGRVTFRVTLEGHVRQCPEAMIEHQLTQHIRKLPRSLAPRQQREGLSMASPQTALRGRLDGSGHGSPKHWALGPALPAPGRRSACARYRMARAPPATHRTHPGSGSGPVPCLPSCAPGTGDLGRALDRRDGPHQRRTANDSERLIALSHGHRLMCEGW